MNNATLLFISSIRQRPTQTTKVPKKHLFCPLFCSAALIIITGILSLPPVYGLVAEEGLGPNRPIAAPAAKEASAKRPAQSQIEAGDAARSEKVDVQWSPVTGTPFSVRGSDLEKQRSYSAVRKFAVQPGSTLQDRAVGVLDNLSKIYGIQDASAESRPSKEIETDTLGFQHIRIVQVFQGLRVVGGDLRVHFDKTGIAYQVTGSYIKDVQIDVTAKISRDEASAAAVKDAEAGGFVSPLPGSTPELVVYAPDIASPVLAYEMRIQVNESPKGPRRWRYWVDATNGKIVNVISEIKSIAAPTTNGAAVAVTGNVLAGEGGGSANVTGWRENTGIHYLYNKSNLWYIHNFATTGWPDNATYAYRSSATWGTSDPVEISAARNMNAVQDYFRTVHGRNSINGSGMYARADIHYWETDGGIVNKKVVNAYWDGTDKKMIFGDGDGITANCLAVLDVTGHELMHGVTDYTANLVYQNEPGALNESFSDIFGTITEFYAQSAGKSNYPNVEAGTADWLLGEDCWVSAKCLRDMKNPSSTATLEIGAQQPSRYKGAYWYTGTGDYGGVHYNGGPQNFFFYLLCEGGSGANDGLAYSVTGIGMNNARLVAYRALTVYCTSFTNYQAARSSWISAAQDLNPSWVPSVKEAWDAVGVGTEQYGSVSVTISPASAVTAGAQWQVDGGSWQNSGTILSGVSTGIHTVSFKALSGWATPGNGNVTVLANQTATASGTYSDYSWLTLPIALNAPSLIWTVGDPARWQPQVVTTHDGEGAAQSATIGDSQQTWLETTVTGPGTLSFWWKVSSETSRDYLRFKVDGAEPAGTAGISGAVDWQQKSLNIASGTHVLRWEYSKDYSISFGSDAGWVDQVTYTSIVAAPTITTSSPLPTGIAAGGYSQNLAASGGTTPYTWSLASGSLPAGLSLTSSGEISGTPTTVVTASFTVRVTGGDSLSSTKDFSLTIVPSGGSLASVLNQPDLVFTTSGNLPWIAQTTTSHDGVSAAKSGPITHNQTSSMQTTVSGPGTFSFWWKVSSESNFDNLTFYIDDVPQSGAISGIVDWQQKSYTVTSGSHSLKWIYSKDPSISSGSDCGWVDQLTLPVNAPTITTPSPLPSGMISMPYSQTLAASGGTTPYTWSVSAGSLPAGVSLSSAGVISGYPSAATTGSFTVRVAGSDGLSSTKEFTIAVTASLANAVDLPGQVFTSSGYQPWVSQTAMSHDGVDAAKSGTITDYETSVMQTTVTGPGIVSFWWKVSSEEDFDYLTFYIDGYEQTWISGSVNWTQQSFNLSAGSHVLEWEYSKDDSLSEGSDCGWVDQLTIQGPTPPTISSPNPLPSGMIGVPYNQAMVAIGGATPYTWSLSSGSLPAGLSLSSAGVISGVPSVVSTASFSVQVTGGDSLSSKMDFNLTVASMGLFADDFEPGIDMAQWSEFGGTVGSTVLASTYGGSVSGTNSLWFGDAGSRYAASRSLNTTPGGMVNFKLRLANGTNSPWEAPDLPAEGVVLEYSINSGSSWVEFGRYNTVSYRSWTHLAVNIPVAAKTANTRFRWRQLANNVGSDHWALDDVAVSINVLPPTVSAPTSAETMATAALLGGNATSDGGATITERGVVYAVTTVNNNPVIGGTGVTRIASSGNTGLFTVVVSGLSSGTSYSFKAYAINSAGTTYTPVANFTTLSPAQCHAVWAAANSLTGSNALPDASPHGDGVKNLIKYAFNLNGSGPDAHRMRAGGTSGQPGAWILQQGAEWYLHVEYVRRKSSGLIYTPKVSTSLAVGSFQPMTGATVVSQIDTNWERVVIEEPYNPASTPRFFSIVEVRLP